MTSEDFGRQKRTLDLSPGTSKIVLRLDPIRRHSLAGEVRFPDGELARHLPIGAWNLGNSQTEFVATDSSGAYRFDDLLAGRYRIVVQDGRPPLPGHFAVLEGAEIRLDRDTMDWTVVVDYPDP